MAFLCHPPEHAQVTTLIQSLSPSHPMAQVQDNPELCFRTKHNLSQFQNPALWLSRLTFISTGALVCYFKSAANKI